VKELVIASNMIALARNRKGGNKRSAMLRMIMPFLSRETGDKLANAIAEKSSKKFALMWDKVKHEIQAKLQGHHTATASDGTYADVTTFERDGETSVCIQTYGPKKVRISMNGITVLDGVPEDGTFVPANPIQMAQPERVIEAPVLTPDNGCAPSDCPQTGNVKTTIAFETENTGEKYVINDVNICLLIKLVCERLLMDADPCPIPPCDTPPVAAPLMPMATPCKAHDWFDCRECASPIPGFDFDANILELYDRLVTCKSL
jgi:hypothetical protein